MFRFVFVVETIDNILRITSYPGKFVESSKEMQRKCDLKNIPVVSPEFAEGHRLFCRDMLLGALEKSKSKMNNFCYRKHKGAFSEFQDEWMYRMDLAEYAPAYCNACSALDASSSGVG